MLHEHNVSFVEYHILMMIAKVHHVSQIESMENAMAKMPDISAMMAMGGGKMPAGVMSGGNPPGGEAPDGETPDGEISDGKTPGEEIPGEGIPGAMPGRIPAGMPAGMIPGGSMTAMNDQLNEMKELATKLTVLRDAIPGAFEKGGENYADAIREKCSEIEAYYQATLNNGYRNMFIFVAAINAFGLLLLVFYREERKEKETY